MYNVNCLFSLFNFKKKVIIFTSARPQFGQPPPINRPNNPFLPNTFQNPQQGTVNWQQNQNRPFQFEQNSNEQQQTTSTTVASTSSTTATPEFLNCTRNVCLTTNEYNPVCGSDQVSYQNIRKLDCANRCGQNLDPNWQGIRIQFDSRQKLIFI